MRDEHITVEALLKQIGALEVEAHKVITDLKLRAEEAEDRADEMRELLRDVHDLNCEMSAIGGGPGYAARYDKAWARVAEEFEP